VDLVEPLKVFIEAGDHLILLIDGNSNMKNSDLRTALEEIHMKEAILQKHGLLGPATHKRNSTSSPIDGIWTTPGKAIERGGYFAYDEVVMNTDH
jgi:hypothetical protein